MTSGPKIRDFTAPGVPEPSVDVELHGAVDLLLAMWLLDGCDTTNQPLDEYGLGEEWYAKFSDSLSPTTRSLVERVGSGDIWIAAMGIVADMPDGSTAEDFIDHVASMDPIEMRVSILSLEAFDDADAARLGRAAAAGDHNALVELLSLPVVEKYERRAANLLPLLEMDPHQTTSLLVDAMQGVYNDAFAGHESEFRPVLERDVAAKRAVAARVSTERFVELATNGISVEKQGYRKPILLVPSIVGRPWNIFTEAPGRLIIAYPVADEYMQADPDAPPAWLVKIYKALGDERRLRVLRRLSRGPVSLHELADELDVSKSTLHHHMMLLRSAGLVTVSLGADKEYALRKDIVPETTAVLQAYIDHTGGT